MISYEMVRSVVHKLLELDPMIQDRASTAPASPPPMRLSGFIKIDDWGFDLQKLAQEAQVRIK